MLRDPGAASRDDGIFMGESLQQERESPWALTLTERVPEAFEIPPSHWPEKFFLANQRRGTAGRLSCLLTRGCFPHQSPEYRVPFNGNIFEESFRKKINK